MQNLFTKTQITIVLHKANREKAKGKARITTIAKLRQDRQKNNEAKVAQNHQIFTLVKLQCRDDRKIATYFSRKEPANQIPSTTFLQVLWFLTRVGSYRERLAH